MEEEGSDYCQGQGQVSGPNVCQLIQIHTVTDLCLSLSTLVHPITSTAKTVDEELRAKRGGVLSDQDEKERLVCFRNAYAGIGYLTGHCSDW
jgi:hypothetical protein